MGLFKKIKKVAKRSVAAVATGGTSEVIRAVSPSLGKKLVNTLVPTSQTQLTNTVAAVALRNPAPLLGNLAAPRSTVSGSGIYPVQSPTIGVQPMGFNIGQFLGQTAQILGGNQNPYFQTVSNVLSPIAAGFAPTYGPAPAPQQMPMIRTAATNSPLVIPQGQSGLTDEILKVGIDLMYKLGLPPPKSMGAFTSTLKRAMGSIASLARRTPAGTIVSILLGLGFGAYESNLLTAWFAQRKRHRRMNPANVKALRRSARRIRSFHKLCQHTDLLKTRSAGRTRSSRCGTCRKSPCRC